MVIESTLFVSFATSEAVQECNGSVSFADHIAEGIVNESGDLGRPWTGSVGIDRFAHPAIEHIVFVVDLLGDHPRVVLGNDADQTIAMIPLVLDRLVIGRSGADPYFAQPIAVVVVRIRFIADVRRSTAVT